MNVSSLLQIFISQIEQRRLTKKSVAYRYLLLLFLQSVTLPVFGSASTAIAHNSMQKSINQAPITAPEILCTNIPSSLYTIKKEGIYLDQAIQSRATQLFIEARGDIYVNKLISSGDLAISTTGHVHVQDDLFVEGSVTLRGNAVTVHASCKVKGHVTLLAESALNIMGAVVSEKILQLVSIEKTTIEGVIEAAEGVILLSGKTLDHRGTVTSEREIVINAQSYKQSGNLVSQQKTAILVEEDLQLTDACTIGVRQLVLTSKGKNLVLAGDLYSEDGVQLSAGEVITLAGSLASKDAVFLTCKQFNLKGSMLATKGALFTIDNGWNLEKKGICKVFGSGLTGRVGNVTNHGVLETQGLTLTIDTGNNYGSIRTHGHFSLTGVKYFNHKESYTFTTGVHQLEFSDDYSDAGDLHTPTLLLAQARTLKFLQGHHAYLKDALLTSIVQLTVQEGVNFDFFGPHVFFQLASNGSVTFRGAVHHDSVAHYPVNRYFDLSHAPTELPNEVAFRAEIEKIAKNHPSAQLRRGSGIMIVVDGNLKYAGTSKLDSGALSVTAGGAVQSEQGTIEAGYFSGDSVTIRSAQVALDQTTIKSYFDSVSVDASDSLTFKNVALSSGISTVIRALSGAIENSMIQSTKGFTSIEVKKAVLLKAAKLKNATQTAIHAHDIGLDGVEITSATTAIIAENALRMYDTKIVSEQSILSGRDVEVRDVSLGGDTAVSAMGDLSIRDLASTGRVATRSGGTTNIAGKVTAGELISQANKAINTGEIICAGEALIVASSVDQNCRITAETIAIESDNYNDTVSSKVTAKKKVELRAAKGTGFKGQLQGDTVAIEMDDLQLENLKQVVARVTQLHLKKDVVIDQKLVLDNTLHLWANRLINNGQVTVNGDFIAQVSTDMLLNGVIDVKGTGSFTADSISSNRGKLSGENLYLQAKEGDVSLYNAVLAATTDIRIEAEKANIKKTASQVHAGQDFGMFAGQNIATASEVAPRPTGGNFADQVHEDRETAGRDIIKKAGKHILMTAVNVKAVHNIVHDAGGRIVDMPLKLESCFASESGNTSGTAKRVTHQGSEHNAGGTFSSRSGGNQDFYATKIAAKRAEIFAEGKVTAHDVHDTYEGNFQETSDGGFFGQKVEKKSYRFDAISKGIEITASEKVEIQAGGDITLTNATVRAPSIKMESVAGAVRLLLGKNRSVTSSSVKRSDLLWQSHEQHVTQDKTYSSMSFDGALELKSKDVFVELVREHVNALVKQIEAQGITAIYNALDELHENEVKKTQGPSPALAAVVVVAVGICTAGTGAALGAAAAGALSSSGALATVITGMTAAAFTSLCCQASLALLCNEGNIIKAAESLASTKTLANIGIAMLTAGLTAGISDLLNIPAASQATSAFDRIERQVLQSTLYTTSRIAQGAKPGEALVEGFKGAVAGAVGAVACSEIGGAYQDHEISFIGHKFLHALVGGATGAVLGDKPLEGAASGAFGAVTAEMLGELVIMNSHKIAENVATKLHENNTPLTKANIQYAVQQELRGKTDVIKLLTSGCALLTGQDVSIATFSASTAIDNNLSHMACSLVEHELYGILSPQKTDPASSVFLLTVDQPPSKDSQKGLHVRSSVDNDAIEPDDLFNGLMETVASAGVSKVIGSMFYRTGAAARAAVSAGVAEESLAQGVTHKIEMGAAKLSHNVPKIPDQNTSAIVQSAHHQESGAVQKGVTALDELRSKSHILPGEVNPNNRAQFIELQKELATQVAPTRVIAKPGTVDIAPELEEIFQLPRDGFSLESSAHRIQGEVIEVHSIRHQQTGDKILASKLKDPQFALKNPQGEVYKTPIDNYSPWTRVEGKDGRWIQGDLMDLLKK